MKNRAFKIKVNGKILDYRLGSDLDLDEARKFFEKKYKVNKIWQGGRHVLGFLEKNNRKLFLKLATTEGISATTQIEYNWNSAFNKSLPRVRSSFWVPKNWDSGFYKDKLFYLVTDRFEGRPLVNYPNTAIVSGNFAKNLGSVINFSEAIGGLNINGVQSSDNVDASNHKEWFVNKTKSWLDSIPENVYEQHGLENLLTIVKMGVSKLQVKPRHGDFTPWHLFVLDSGKLGLIDGEHAKADSVEGYDIGYLIQRVFSVLKSTKLAEQIFQKLIKRQYSVEKLRVILAARAIGGFLDEFLVENPDYLQADRFRNWVVSL
ncbi:MAG: hypothetical protein UU34_C0008G0036 [Candidatus Curtissbacteria bacterium GW2011_GWA1_41_11]|uniref:Aminoglycoside phosphotransferase domain-containing protein n=1 Tax=Candidatus Curtissbacteria bacterium GW2011_GWA1_41_11 TaxID=1618409 RepID=A0A0G0XGZ9_9BACT|nr:MAG: hypothetical protein UU34_C0008G0036 [Candidatus Curtissbacteria bacterium GW2011_GWA1_41_11]